MSNEDIKQGFVMEYMPEKTLRDEFAIAAMSGLNANPASVDWTAGVIARLAYEQADAMMEARK